jgi:hypothetical protein
MLRAFVLLAIRSSVAYRLCQAVDARGTPPASTPRMVRPLRGPLHA